MGGQSDGQWFYVTVCTRRWRRWPGMLPFGLRFTTTRMFGTFEAVRGEIDELVASGSALWADASVVVGPRYR